jgi:metal-sulfur cluster biosynthetic enzyme
VNIYDLGLIYEVRVDEEQIAHITMTLTAPNCPMAEDLVRRSVTRLPVSKGLRIVTSSSPSPRPGTAHAERRGKAGAGTALKICTFTGNGRVLPDPDTDRWI